MEMTYTACEVCGVEQYCFLQFRTDIKENESDIIKRAVCTQCLKVIYETMMTGKRIKNISYSS